MRWPASSSYLSQISQLYSHNVRAFLVDILETWATKAKQGRRNDTDETRKTGTLRRGSFSWSAVVAGLVVLIVLTKHVWRIDADETRKTETRTRNTETQSVLGAVSRSVAVVVLVFFVVCMSWPVVWSCFFIVRKCMSQLQTQSERGSSSRNCPHSSAANWRNFYGFYWLDVARLKRSPRRSGVVVIQSVGVLLGIH